MRRFDEGPSGPFEPPVPGGGVPPPRRTLSPILRRRVSVCRPAGHPFPVDLFYDDESRNWGFRVEELHITGGGQDTIEEARRAAAEAVAYALEGEEVSPPPRWVRPGPRIWWTAALLLSAGIWALGVWVGWLPIILAAGLLALGWAVYCGAEERRRR
jgi:hypothetical protein